MGKADFDGAEINILNWDKFCPRKDLKATSWLRLQNTLFEDPSFYDFDHSEICFWIYLLSQASKKQAGLIRLSVPHAERVGRFKKTIIESSIEKLKLLQCVQITITARDADDTRTSRQRVADVTLRNVTNERTNETKRYADDTSRDADVTNGKLSDGLKVEPAPTAAVWEAYRESYRDRYGEDPVRNVTVNSQIKQFVARVPASEAPDVARFYLGHNDSFYVKKMHPTGMLLQDAEKLRTEWATGNRMTGGKAREVERKQEIYDTWKPFIEEAENADHGNG